MPKTMQLQIVYRGVYRWDTAAPACALPQPDVNADVEGQLSDFVWRCERLMVETDSRRAHTTVAAFERIASATRTC
jgi:hypothetical protein